MVSFGLVLVVLMLSACSDREAKEGQREGALREMPRVTRQDGRSLGARAGGLDKAWKNTRFTDLVEEWVVESQKASASRL